jgi:trk system potassium uptake protein TrkH
MPDARRAAPPFLPVAGRQAPARVALAPVLRFFGLVLCCLATVMLAPAALDLADGHAAGFRAFLAAAAATLFAGVALALACSGGAARIGLREGVLAVTLTWAGAILFGALPFLLAERPLSFTDAVFETASGLTATASTVYVGLDRAPRGILLWRFLLAWLGGFGLVTFAVLVLPYLRVGGLQLFMVDLSARPGKFLPRTAEVVAQIAAVYLLLTFAGAVSFGAAGMGALDALGHAMAAVATAGFSSHDAGLGYFRSPAVEWTATVFMLLGALPFVLYVHLLRGQAGPLLRETQVRLFLLLVAAGVLLLALWRLAEGGVGAGRAFREATFNVVSIISTTGFTSHDFHEWGGFASLLLLCAMLVGGCTGSTAGGLKMFRLCVLLEALKAQVRRQVLPNGVFGGRYNGRPIPPGVVAAVVAYAFAYLASFALLALALALTGLTLEESLGASATALSGAGPGLGPRIGPCCTFAPLSDAATWLLVLGMLAGRLEILLLVMPFTRGFWRA